MAATLEVSGLPELLRRVAALPRSGQVEWEEAAERIASEEAGRIRSAGGSSDRQSARMAGSVRASGDSVSAGGLFFFGSEFGGQGSSTTMQFRPHRGSTGYWFWPTIRRDEDRIMRRYEDAVRAIEREWSR